VITLNNPFQKFFSRREKLFWIDDDFDSYSLDGIGSEEIVRLLIIMNIEMIRTLKEVIKVIQILVSKMGGSDKSNLEKKIGELDHDIEAIKIELKQLQENKNASINKVIKLFKKTLSIFNIGTGLLRVAAIAHII